MQQETNFFRLNAPTMTPLYGQDLFPENRDTMYNNNNKFDHNKYRYAPYFSFEL